MQRNDFLWFRGLTWKNCGQSPGQAAALASDQAFQKAVTSQYATTVGQNQAILGDLTGNLESIVNAGPSQQGFSPAELAVYNSQALNSAAAANKNVQAEIGENGAMASATPGVESGVEQAEKASAATQVENNLSNQQMNITAQNFQTGRENYNNAVKELAAAPGELESPINSAAGEVNTSNSSTANQANENAQANNQWQGMVMGIAGDATNFFKPTKNS